MYDLFSKNNEIKYLVTRLDLNRYISLLNEEIDENIKKKEALSDSRCNDGKRKSYDETINSLRKKSRYCKATKKKKKVYQLLPLLGLCL